MKIKKRNLIIISMYFVAFLGSNIFFKDGDLTIPNLFIACFSILLFTYGFDKFCSKINAANTFLTFFYLGLALNCLSLSGLQTKKEFKDIYFYFVGPLIFFATLRIIESIKFKKIKIKSLKIKRKIYSIYNFWTIHCV